MSLVTGLEGGCVLKEVVLGWLEEFSAVNLDSAVCNHECRPSLLRVLESTAKAHYVRGDDSYHRSISKLLIVFQFNQYEMNVLVPWCVAKLNWCIIRSVEITSLHLEDIDLAEPVNIGLNKLNLKNVVHLEVSERGLYYPKHRSHSQGTVSDIMRRLTFPERCHALSAIINRFPRLVCLSVDNTTAASYDCFVKISETILNQLYKLVLQTKCDSGSIAKLLELLAERCTRLVVLSIDDSLTYIVDVAHQQLVSSALVKLIENNKMIEDFSMEFNPVITSALFGALTTHCSELRYLKCSVVWDYHSDVIYLAQIINSCRQLLRLEITADYDCDILYSPREGLMLRCINVTDVHICSSYLNVLFQALHAPLTKVRLWGVKQLHPDVLICIGKKNPMLQLLITMECDFAFPEATSLQVLKQMCPAVKIDNINSNRGIGKLVVSANWASMYSQFAFTKASPKLKIDV